MAPAALFLLARPGLLARGRVRDRLRAMIPPVVGESHSAARATGAHLNLGPGSMTDQDEDDLDVLWTQATALKDKMMQVLDNNSPTEDVAMLATASLVAQVLDNLHDGDNEEAIDGLYEVWLPNIEGIVKSGLTRRVRFQG